MAGSSTDFLYDNGNDREGQHCNVKKVTLAWVSDDTTGAVTGTTGKVVGYLLRAVTVPSGTVAPTANYDVAITDEYGANVLAGCLDSLQNRSASATEEVHLNLSDDGASPLRLGAYPPVCGPLTVAVTNAGNAKAGTLVLYYRPV